MFKFKATFKSGRQSTLWVRAKNSVTAWRKVVRQIELRFDSAPLTNVELMESHREAENKTLDKKRRVARMDGYLVEVEASSPKEAIRKAYSNDHGPGEGALTPMEAHTL